MLPFKNHTHLWTATLPPSPSQHLVCSLLLKFCHFKMLHKWDHDTQHFGTDSFYTLEGFPKSWVSMVASFLLPSGIPW